MVLFSLQLFFFYVYNSKKACGQAFELFGNMTI